MAENPARAAQRAMFWQLAPRTLRGRSITLERLRADLREAVRSALSTDDEAWQVMVANGSGEHFADWWADAVGRMRRAEAVFFAIRRKADRAIIGTMGYHSFCAVHRRVEIGSSFLRPDARSSSFNPEAKLMLLERAFAAGAVRVEFVTDALNLRSRAALLKLGAVHEGVLRQHKITWTGRVRDTAVYSVTADEWPGVRQQLQRRLEPGAES
jgi:RimJ/RimL family protein N-acetyltransferase